MNTKPTALDAYLARTAAIVAGGGACLDRARQKQRKQRNSGGRRDKMGAIWRSVKFTPLARPRQGLAFAGMKKPGACPGFRGMVVRGLLPNYALLGLMSIAAGICPLAAIH